MDRNANGSRCGAVRKSSNLLKAFISGMSLFLVCVALTHIITDDWGPDMSKASSAIVRRMIHTQPDPTQPWTDPIWVKRVQQSGASNRGGGYAVLVTGAAGFIGSRASLSIKKKGWGVVGIDNFNDFYDPGLQRERQTMIHKEGRVFIAEGHINDETLLRKIFELVKITHVLHLAAQAGVDDHGHNPQSYIRSNVAGLVSLLEVCAKANPQPALVWASSSAVYGLNTRVPFSEADRTDRPASFYAATKKAGEAIVHSYNHIYGLSATGLRFFAVYGPWGRPDMPVFGFTKAILDGTPITIVTGQNNESALARDWTYIDDIVTGCIAALETAEKSTGGPDKSARVRKKIAPAQLRLFNLGNSRPVSVTEMVLTLERHLQKKAVTVFEQISVNGSDVPACTNANLSLAETHLGYRPRTDLNTGLKAFVKWYLDRHQIAMPSTLGHL